MDLGKPCGGRILVVWLSLRLNRKTLTPLRRPIGTPPWLGHVNVNLQRNSIARFGPRGAVPPLGSCSSAEFATLSQNSATERLLPLIKGHSAPPVAQI